MESGQRKTARTGKRTTENRQNWKGETGLLEVRRRGAGGGGGCRLPVINHNPSISAPPNQKITPSPPPTRQTTGHMTGADDKQLLLVFRWFCSICRLSIRKYYGFELSSPCTTAEPRRLGNHGKQNEMVICVQMMKKTRNNDI